MLAVATQQQDNFFFGAPKKMKKEKTSDRLGNSMLHKDEVVAWLQSVYCIDPTGRRSIPKHTVYQEYTTYSHNNGWAVGSAATCGRLVHRGKTCLLYIYFYLFVLISFFLSFLAFPTVVCSRKGGRGNAIYHYKNLCRKTDLGENNNSIIKIEKTKEESVVAPSSSTQSSNSTYVSHFTFFFFQIFLLTLFSCNQVGVTQAPQPTCYFSSPPSDFGVPIQTPSTPADSKSQLRWVDQLWDSFDYSSDEEISSQLETPESYLADLLSLDQSPLSDDEGFSSDSESLTLETGLEGYYRNILNSLTPSTRDPLEKTKPFISHFWQYLFPSLVQGRSIQDFFYLEQRELLLLIVSISFFSIFIFSLFFNFYFYFI